jgi:fatty acid amide hydrolase
MNVLPLNSKKKVFLGALGTYAAFKAWMIVKGWYSSYKINAKASKKLTERKSIVLEHKVSPEKQEYILSLTASELAESILQKKVTSLEATTTYISRSSTLGREYSLVADECYELALRQAADCDEKLKNGIILGPLHGVPISIKDNLRLKGSISTSGVVWKLDFINDDNALIVQLLIEQGAVPFVKSNVPQLLLATESFNKIFGRALNPWDLNRTPGGSSGGEAGLVACRASPLGIGTDIAGSVRFPAAFCGVYGLKPTSRRISTKGLDSPFENGVSPLSFIIKSTPGPIGKCVDDLVLFMKILLTENMFNEDIELPPLEFNQKVYDLHKTKLKIGYFLDLPYFDSAPCIKNSIHNCINQLKKKHDVVEFKIPYAQEIINLAIRVISANGNIDLRKALKGESPESFYRIQFLLNDYPKLKRILMMVLRFTGNQRMSEFIDVKSNISPSEYIEIFQKLQEVTEKFTEHWENIGLDALIGPVFGLVGPNHNETFNVIPGITYSTIWNALGYPAGVVPVGLVKTNETEYVDKYNDMMTKFAKKSMKNAEGMPIAIQVIGLPYKDELVLGVMKIIENIYEFHKHPI